MLYRLLQSIEDFLRKMWPERPRSVLGFIFQFIGAVSSFAFILSYFNVQGVAVLGRLAVAGRRILDYTQLQEVPRIVWLLAAVFAFYLASTRKRVNLVAGTFTDDFSNGLVNWEYGGEG